MRRLTTLRVQQIVYATSTHTHTHTSRKKHKQRAIKTAVSACSTAARLIPNSTKSTNSATSFRIPNFVCNVRIQLQLPTDCAAIFAFLSPRCFFAAACRQLFLLLLPPPRVVNSMWKLKLTTDVGHAAEGSQQSSSSRKQQQASSSSSWQHNMLLPTPTAEATAALRCASFRLLLLW